MSEIDEHPEGCTCGVPEDATVVSVVTLVKYMDSDGEMYRADFSHDASGEPLTYDEYIALTKWGELLYSLPMLADMLGFEPIEDEE